ncbi:unnamed protein product [Rotaria sp. Silwood2]|nr:unnamed protein product [Rotaria sp. Silwood2]CAF4611271.1 unnamed protein product [Rotaria sp. Silwood2]
MNKDIVNQRFNEIYPAFVIPETSHEVILINRYMSMEVMDKVLNHIKDCYQYSVDTESEMSTHELSIIQFHTIPRTLPSQVLIIELSQLPNRQSHLYVKIKEVFRLIFRSHNEIYSWGDMNLELESANYLFTWPITSELINLQSHFPGWYEWARTQCRVQSLEQQAMENNDIIADQRNLSASSCICHRPSPYNEHQLWSLQKAFLYSFNLFIDKTSTLSHWSYGLSSIGSSLTHVQRKKMINYAKNDVMAVTYLIRPITEQWSLTRTKESSIEEMFITFQSKRSPPLRQPKSKNKIKNINVQKLSKIFTSINDSDYELISSDDEIYLNQLIEPVVNVYCPRDQIINDDMAQDVIRDLDDNVNVELQIDGPTIDVIMNNDDDQTNSVNNHYVVVDGMNNPTEHQQQRIKKKRSLQAKQKKNRKRNNKLRLHRYKYYLTRSYYHRFKSRSLKKVLRYYDVQYRHIKFQDDKVVIGVKTKAAQRDYEEALPHNCFNRRNYYRFRR